MKITREIELTETRCCECGRFWASEATFLLAVTCPFCAAAALKKATAQSDAAERSIRAYKAHRTRNKNS